MRLATIFAVFCSLAVLDAYKYLVMSPLFGHSHSNFMGKLADILTEAGHEVHLLLPVLDESLVNKTGVKLTKHVEIYDADPRALVVMNEMKNGFMKNLWTAPADPVSMMKNTGMMAKMWAHSCKKMANDVELHQRLKAENYDAGIAEPFIACPLAVMDQIGIRTIIGTVSTYQLHTVAAAIGEPGAASYVPSLHSPNGEKMTLLQRMANVFANNIGAYVFRSLNQGEMEQIHKKFNNNRQLSDIISDMPILFTNNNPYLNYARPILAKNIQIGGITVHTKAKKVNKELDDILNLRKKTVFISFGSVAKSKDMPELYRNTLLSVMESMPDVTFIWKYEEKTNFADHVKNVILHPWLPQTDLLADPRLSVFITHGGLGSITEVAYMGKPTIMIPLFAEQPRNAAMLARHGCGIPLKKEDLSDANKIKTTIETILNNDSYAKSAKALAEVLNNPPIEPKEIFLKYTEFATRVGKLPQLDPYGRHLSLIEYYLIDGLALVVSVFFVVILLALIALKFAVRKCTKTILKPKKE